jgi:hypothetical protein
LKLHPGMGGLILRISAPSRVTECYPRTVLETERKPGSAQTAGDRAHVFPPIFSSWLSD